MIDFNLINSWINTVNIWLTANPEVIVFVLIWQIVWMGIALWISAREKHIIWFVVFLLIHTLGILDILYIFWFSRIGFKKKSKNNKKSIRRK